MKTLLGILCLLFGIGCQDAELGARAKAAVEDGALLVDVRSPGEFAGGHVEGAINVPVGELEGRLAEIDNEQVVVYCRSGGRSARAARILEAAGKIVVDMGGMSNWPSD